MLELETVTASVKIDEFGVAKGVDNENKQNLRAASWKSNTCYVRDIEAHQTIEVRFVGGQWMA